MKLVFKKINAERVVENLGIPLDPKPIVDVVRHGRTKEKENSRFFRTFGFRPTSRNVKLDSQHLDLTDDGINDIYGAAEQLGEIIDKEREIIVLITSPKFRTRSSLLLMKDALLKMGVSILNPNEMWVFDEITERHMKNSRARKRYGAQWKKVRDQITENDKMSVFAKMVNDDARNIFYRDYEGIDRTFRRFLDYIINTTEWLDRKFLEKVYGKRLRVICLSHQEVTQELMRQLFGTDQELQRQGQILEIEPEDSRLKITLFPKGKDSLKKEISVETGIIYSDRDGSACPLEPPLKNAYTD